MATRTARSAEPNAPAAPAAAVLKRLKLSAEVGWYLVSRGIPLPDCPPLVKTPEPGDLPDVVFDAEAVDRVLKAYGQLRHTQGKWAGQPLRPDPWQIAYVLAPVFGWKRWDDDAQRWVRVIRNLYVDVPRKNGKSTLAGGIAVYLACGDGEQGAQVVTAATTEKQASFVFGPIKTLAEKSPGLKRHVKTLQKRIIHPRTGSYIEVITSAADAQHGANIHGAVIDELHVHKTPDMVETLETGTGSRDQPLIVIITTADSGKPGSIYDRKRRYVESLARGAVTDATTYGVVWAAAKRDDPHAETTWRKANPGFGISPTRSYMAGASGKAKQSPADLAAFLRLHLGVRTKQETKFLALAAWNRGGVLGLDEQRFAGREAYGGLDLASVSDLCALAWVMPDDELGGYEVLFRLWTPEDNVEALDRRTGGNASVWVREGLLRTTPGNVVDYAFIRRDAGRDLDLLDARSIGFDAWNSSALVTDLQHDGAQMVPVRQGFGSLSAPLKEVQRLVLAGTEEAPLLRHAGSAAVGWQVDNLAVAMDASGNVKPDKKNAGDKIDALAALTTAMSEAMTREPPSRSAYEDGDLIVI